MIENTKKRLREAQYFYRQLIEITRRPTTLMNEPEAFEFNLNACLTAARSVSWTLENEEKAKYEAWHSSWESGLSPNDRALLKFTNEQRIAIVKRGGTEAKSEDRYVPITTRFTRSSCVSNLR
jgi:hypothetical protein